MLIVCILIFITIVFIIICFGDNSESHNKELINKVHFYVTCDSNNPTFGLQLWIGKPSWYRPTDCLFHSWVGWKPVTLLADSSRFSDFNLNINDFTEMKKGEIREVFINLED